MKDFCCNEGLLISDIILCDDDTFTFYSEAHHSTSWLDHVLTTSSAHCLIDNIWVEYGMISSDHHPIVTRISVNTDNLDNDTTVKCSNIQHIQWDMLSDDDLIKYKNSTELTLSEVELNHDMILCDNPKCSSESHRNAIARMYDDITKALAVSGKPFSSNAKGKKFNQVLGWNDYCKAAHDQARDAYLLWRESGRSRQGILFDSMKKSRAYFKYVFRKCKSADSTKMADALANKLLYKDDKQFWKELSRINNDKCSIATTVNNTSGPQNITAMWKQHFEGLLNSSVDTSVKDDVTCTLKNDDLYFSRFTIADVLKGIKSLKHNKAAGLDHLSGEHFQFAHDKIAALLAIVFNAMIIHDFLPPNLLDTIIVPIIKDKMGDVTDKDNYRPLAITCVASKVFEFIILHRYEYLLVTTANQFGFKNQLATDMCIFSLKQVIEYYKYYNSPVYICYLDASKAFDKINHWHLFSKLLARKVPCIIVRLLLTWYSCQTYVIRWSSCISSPFSVSNGVPQGRILSPIFFNLYMNDLSVRLNEQVIGCNYNGVVMNHMFYADDSVLLAPSPTALQKLLNICYKYGCDFEIKYNVKKTECMCVKPKGCKSLLIPDLFLGGQVLIFTDCKKYLGAFICDNLSDDKDIKRQIRSVYTKGNLLIKKFRNCTSEVKVKLFKSYCSSFYGCTLWARSSDASRRKLVVAYKKIFRNFMKCQRLGTTQQMLMLHIDPYDVIYRKLVFSFRNRILTCDNLLVQTIATSLHFYSTYLYKQWNKVLFTL